MIRAAASSMASGSPSSRRQIVGHRRRRCRPSARKSGWTAWARSTKSRTAVGRAPLVERPTAGARIRQRQRRHRELVLAADAQRGAAGDEHREARAAGEQRRHDRRRRDAPARSCRAPAAALGRARRRVSRVAQRRDRPLARRRAPGRSPAAPAPGRASGASGDEADAVREVVARARAASCSASRVLPTPPGPVSVSSRTSRRASNARSRRAPARGRRTPSRARAGTDRRPSRTTNSFGSPSLSTREPTRSLSEMRDNASASRLVGSQPEERAGNL